jgi:hypothetical protein
METITLFWEQREPYKYIQKEIPALFINKANSEHSL